MIIVYKDDQTIRQIHNVSYITMGLDHITAFVWRKTCGIKTKQGMTYQIFTPVPIMLDDFIGCYANKTTVANKLRELKNEKSRAK